MSFGYTRQIIRGLIPSLIGEGLTANAALRLLISQDLGIRRKTFLDDWREFSGIAKKSKAYLYTPRKYKIPEDAFVETAKNITGARQYIFDVDVKDLETGDIFQSKYSFVSNDILTRQQAEQTMASILDNAAAVNDDYAESEVIAVWFDVGLRRQDAAI